MVRADRHFWLLGNDHLTWRGGRGGYCFFLKKYLIPNIAEKNILILVEEKNDKNADSNFSAYDTFLE
jgi:hypothetical protein